MPQVSSATSDLAAQAAAAEQARRAAEEQARRAAEEQARKAAEEQARRAAQEQAQRQAEEQSRRDAAQQIAQKPQSAQQPAQQPGAQSNAAQSSAPVNGAGEPSSATDNYAARTSIGTDHVKDHYQQQMTNGGDQPATTNAGSLGVVLEGGGSVLKGGSGSAAGEVWNQRQELADPKQRGEAIQTIGGKAAEGAAGEIAKDQIDKKLQSRLPEKPLAGEVAKAQDEAAAARKASEAAKDFAGGVNRLAGFVKRGADFVGAQGLSELAENVGGYFDDKAAAKSLVADDLGKRAADLAANQGTVLGNVGRGALRGIAGAPVDGVIEAVKQHDALLNPNSTADPNKNIDSSPRAEAAGNIVGKTAIGAVSGAIGTGVAAAIPIPGVNVVAGVAASTAVNTVLDNVGVDDAVATFTTKAIDSVPDKIRDVAGDAKDKAGDLAHAVTNPRETLGNLFG